MDVAQNFDHLLDPISGYNGMHDLQFKGPVDLVNDSWHRGALMFLSTTGIIRPAAKVIAALATVAKHAMGMWAINAAYDLDVVGNQTWPAGSPPLYRGDRGNISGGVVACFPATGGLELVTTEFNPSATYNENVPLVAYVPGGGESAERAGWMTVGTIRASGALALEENIVGVVSATGPAANGSITEVYNQRVIRFWPVYQPAREFAPPGP